MTFEGFTMFTKLDRELLVGLTNRLDALDAFKQNVEERLSALEEKTSTSIEQISALKKDIQKVSEISDNAEQEIRTMLLYTVMEEIPDDAKKTTKKSK